MVVAIAALAMGPLRAENIAHTREYWIKAEEVLWNYAPSYPIEEMMILQKFFQPLSKS